MKRAGIKKVAVISRWPYYLGGRKAGFHCTKNILSKATNIDKMLLKSLKIP